MVSSDLWKVIELSLGEIFMMIAEKAFACLSVMTVADLLQLLPDRGKLIFSQFSLRIVWNIRFAVMAFGCKTKW